MSEFVTARQLITSSRSENSVLLGSTKAEVRDSGMHILEKSHMCFLVSLLTCLLYIPGLAEMKIPRKEITTIMGALQSTVEPGNPNPTIIDFTGTCVHINDSVVAFCMKYGIRLEVWVRPRIGAPCAAYAVGGETTSSYRAIVLLDSSEQHYRACIPIAGGGTQDDVSRSEFAITGGQNLAFG